MEREKTQHRITSQLTGKSSANDETRAKGRQPRTATPPGLIRHRHSLPPVEERHFTPQQFARASKPALTLPLSRSQQRALEFEEAITPLLAHH
ncbi:hypothetical protein E2C01_088217 [Portunus trituberculatus]|uniref:Uncharacterized protein n=1 Tax=Portunus trituberculatus TaxID=210409 RepID=A0A5B7JIM5_PORTR|nr:hypothetical protein [Portunus trituberculatus]